MPPPTPPDPYADIQLDPAMENIASAIQGRMSQWIDERIDRLAVQLEKRADAVSKEITGQMQTKFESVALEMIQSAENTLKDINAIKPKFTNTPFAADIEKLEKAVAEHKAAMEKRREEFRQYGVVVGQVAKAALMTAAKL